MLRVCHRVQLGVYLGVCLGVCLSASCELTWEHTVKQAGSVRSRPIGSILETMPRSVLENVLGGVPGSVLGVDLGASGECKSSRPVVYNQVQSEVYFRVYLGACKKVYFAVWFEV
jgi:hypothetical protein